MFHIITGGSGSGKSGYAEDTICRMKEETKSRYLYYIATMIPYGEETGKKIQRHRKLREGKGFETLECFTGLSHLTEDKRWFSKKRQAEGICVLLECMSNLAANEMYEKSGSGKNAADTILRGVKELKEKCRGLTVVTNEVFSSMPISSGEMDDYLRILGEVNCRMAQEADKVTEIVYGIEVKIKG